MKRKSGRLHRPRNVGGISANVDAMMVAFRKNGATKVTIESLAVHFFQMCCVGQLGGGMAH